LVFVAWIIYRSFLQTGAGEGSLVSSEGSMPIVVTVTDSGFEPSEVTVKAGGTITWVNESSVNIQVGSDDHPTHNVNRDITGGAFVLELAPGDSTSITVTQIGNWGYHDHLQPGKKGRVTIQ
jgi:plastocyanin